MSVLKNKMSQSGKIYLISESGGFELTNSSDSPDCSGVWLYIQSKIIRLAEGSAVNATITIDVKDIYGSNYSNVDAEVSIVKGSVTGANLYFTGIMKNYWKAGETSSQSVANQPKKTPTLRVFKTDPGEGWNYYEDPAKKSAVSSNVAKINYDDALGCNIGIITQATEGFNYTKLATGSDGLEKYLNSCGYANVKYYNQQYELVDWVVIAKATKANVLSMDIGQIYYLGSSTEAEIPSGVTTIKTNTITMTPSGKSTGVELSKIIVPSSFVNATSALNIASLNEITFKDPDNSEFNFENTNLTSTQLSSIEIPSNTKTLMAASARFPSTLTVVTFGEQSKLEEISGTAFMNCQNLNISIPLTNLVNFSNTGWPETVHITFVGTSSSYGDDGLLIFDGRLCAINTVSESVVLPESVKVINDGLFKENKNVQSVTFPSSLEEIGASAFQGCDSLTTVVFNGNNLVKIGDNAFRSTAINSLTLPESLLVIGNNAFRNCTSLAEVTISSASLNLMTYCFDGCTSLSSLVFTTQSGTNFIFEQGCLNNTVLSNIVFPEGTKEIQKIGVTNAGNIHLPSTVDTILPDSFDGCNLLEQITVAENNQYFFAKNGLLVKRLVGEGEEQQQDVLWIVPRAMTDVTIPSDVKSIYNSADGKSSVFRNHYHISSITFETGCSADITDYLFSYCSTLESITFQNGCTIAKIGMGAFSNSGVITINNMPKTVTEFADYSFYQCDRLETITFEPSSSLKKMGYHAFYGCSSLSYITIPGSVREIKDGAFGGCYHLISFQVEQNEYVSYSKGSLIVKEVIADNSGSSAKITLKYVTPTAEKIYVAKEVQSISDWAFCDEVAKDVEVDDGNTMFSSISGLLMNKDGTQILHVPSGLRTVVIPGTVTMVDDGVFTNNETVKSIIWISNKDIIVGQSAFSNMKSLSRLELSSDRDVTIAANSISGFSLSSVVINGENVIVGSNLWSISNQFTFDLNADSISLAEGSSEMFRGLNGQPCTIKELDLTTKHNVDLPSLFSKNDGENIFGNVKVVINSNDEDSIKAITGRTLSCSQEIDGFSLELLKIINLNDNCVATFNVDTFEKYLSDDLVVTINGESVSSSNLTYTVTLTEENNLMSFTLVDTAGLETVTLSLHYGSSESDVVAVSIPKGHSITRTEFERAISSIERSGFVLDSWYKDQNYKTSAIPYTLKLDEDTSLFAKWILITGSKIILDDSHLKAYVGGEQIGNGSFVSPGSVVKVIWTEPQDFEFVQWDFIKGDWSSVGYTATVTANSDVEIGVKSRYISTSNILLNASTVSVPISDVSLKWQYRGQVDTSSTIWTGFPSIPLIVDNYVFIRVNDDILKLDIEDGTVLKARNTTNTTVYAYYHYLGYGDGLIFDYASMSVLDLDLNKVCNLDKKYTAIYANDGCYYGIADKVYKFKISDSAIQYDAVWNGGVDVRWYSGYGTTSSPIFVADHIYFVEVDGQKRFIGSINLINGQHSSKEIEELEGYLMDDGWLTHYSVNGKEYIFTTGYTRGLFDSDGQKYSKVVAIGLTNDGGFDSRIIEYELTGMTGTTSAFLVNEGRGFVNTSGTKTNYLDKDGKINTSKEGSFMFVLDVNELLKTEGREDAKVEIYCEESVFSHGSIVMNTSYYESTGHTYVYLLAYNPSDQAVYIFDDYEGKSGPSGYLRSSPAGASFGSQAVRFGPDGQMIWYTDSGTVYCYVPISENIFSFFIDYGSAGKWIQSAGYDAYDALINALGENSMDYEIDSEGIVRIGDVNNTTSMMWSVYAINNDDWILFDIISGQSNSKTYLISYGIEKNVNKHWAYIDESGIAKAHSLNMGCKDEVIGKEMFTSELSIIGVKISGNSITGTIVINKDLKIDPKLVIYTKFQNSTFIKNKMSLRMIDGVATVVFEMCGTSVPYQLLISLQGPAGDTGTTQLLQKTIDLSSLLAAS